MRQTPVVSLAFDPDDFLVNNELGFHSKSVEKLVKDIGFLLDNPKFRRKMGVAGQKYMNSNHDIRITVSQLNNVFLDITAKK